MKKMIVVATALSLGFAVQAANLDWKYQGVKAQDGQNVYVVLGSTAQSSWESEAALSDAAVDSGTVAKSGLVYVAQGTAIDDAITKTSANFYYVLVSADGKSFQTSSVIDGKSMVYDPDAMESTSGALTTKNADAGWGSATTFSGGGSGGGGVPEPTSGLLLLVGGALLGLRRKRA